MKRVNTTWNHVGKWYNKLVDKSGSYFHEHIVIPNSLRLLSLTPNSSLLDIACGQGILERKIPENLYYEGIDIAKTLIEFAHHNKSSQKHLFHISDVSKSLGTQKSDFTHAVIILALQNIEYPHLVIQNIAGHLSSKGKLLIVLNHPCFRIPRQSGWEIDKQNKIEYRRINRYSTSLKIPIKTHPGQQTNSSITWTFHHPLSYYFQILKNDFVVDTFEEWTSDKQSVGKASKMENRARNEFPLFAAILAAKRY